MSLDPPPPPPPAPPCPLSPLKEDPFFGCEEGDVSVLLMRKLIAKNFEKRDRDESGLYMLKLASEIPMRIFSGSRLWSILKDDGSTIELLVPTLIISIERLLQEVELRGLTNDQEVCHDFNPIDFLAQHLHHNNPRYLNVPVLSTYILRLRNITKELCLQLYANDKKRINSLKEKAQRKRQQQSHRNKLQQEEMDERLAEIKAQFSEWMMPFQNKLELKSVKGALQSFLEFSQEVPKKVFESSELDLNPGKIEESDRMVNCNEFSDIIVEFTTNMDRPTFKTFMGHLRKYACAYQYTLNTHVRRRVLINLFMVLDKSQLGVLDRHRMLRLLEEFWETTNEEIRAYLNHPRRWPVVEVEESEFPVDEIVPVEPSPEFIPEPETESEIEPQTETEAEAYATNEEEFWSTEVDEGNERKEGNTEPTSKKASPEMESPQNVTSPLKSPQNVSSPIKSPGNVTSPIKSPGNVTSPIKSPGNVTSPIKSPGNVSSPLKSSENTPPLGEPGTGSRQPSLQVPGTGSRQPSLQGTGTGSRQPSLQEPGAGSRQPSLQGAETQPASKETPSATDTSQKIPAGPRPVSFAERCLREREPTTVSLTSASASAFDGDTLNTWQFVQLMENFMGPQHEKIVFETVTDFIFNNYVETDEERLERQEKARLEMETMKCKQLADSLFDKWDNDSTGYLELCQVETAILKYKGGKDAIRKAKKRRVTEDRLSKREFRNFILDVTKYLPTQNEYEAFIDYLKDNVELSQLEVSRGDARKKWLHSIIMAGKTNGTQLSPVFNRVFSTICKDAGIHGGGKKINAYIALLVPNYKNPEERGENFLHYMAATPDHAEFVKGQILYRDMKGVSFMCVDKGVPVYVPKVKTHGNIHFWNQSQWKSEDKVGSFLLVPLKDNRKRVFGVLGIDTINDPNEKMIFLTHEINFYQGVAKAFSIAYHQVEVRKRVVKILKSATRWIHRHCIDVCEITVYIVEKSRKTQEIILKKMLATNPQGSAETFEHPPVLECQDSLFREYLFRCVENSETVSDDAYGQHHLAFPLRDKDGMVSFVVDIGIGPEMKKLPSYENRELLRILRVMEAAHREIYNELKEGEACTVVLAAEEKADELRVEVMFDRLLLTDLREKVNKLDIQAYAELRSYTSPPPIIKTVLEAVLCLFYDHEAKQELIEDWPLIKNYVNFELCQKITQFDPTSSNENIDVEKIEKKLKDIPPGEVSKQGSVPTEYFYNWLFVCLSLIEHSREGAEQYLLKCL